MSQSSFLVTGLLTWILCQISMLSALQQIILKLMFQRSRNSNLNLMCCYYLDTVDAIS